MDSSNAIGTSMEDQRSAPEIVSASDNASSSTLHRPTFSFRPISTDTPARQLMSTPSSAHATDTDSANEKRNQVQMFLAELSKLGLTREKRKDDK